MAISQYQYKADIDSVIADHLTKFQRRTGCFVEFASVFGSSQRGYGTLDSDSDVGFVFDYPHPTTLALRSNVRFKVENIEFIGTSREFFLEKLGSCSIHHWIVLLADSPFLINDGYKYKKLVDTVLASKTMRQDLARLLLHSGFGRFQSSEYNLFKNFGVAEDGQAIEKHLAMSEFCAAIKHNLQAMYTAALGLALSTGQKLVSHDILDLLGMTELGKQIIPDAKYLIELRRSEAMREQFDNKKLFALPLWATEIQALAISLPSMPYEGSSSPYANIYDPLADDKYNILEGTDNPIRRAIVECFF